MPFRDALRHNSAPRCTFKIRRKASRTAFLRWSVGTIIPTIVRCSASSCRFMTLCVTTLRRAVHSRSDAKRPEPHSYAGA
ncbi:hypothetical protein XJ28_11465 [Pseudomonas syringae pv. tomato]|nr:hypothetical protein XJ28_11465 [Pseudomonas syringae pv. tomato]QBI63983.1 DUF1534 domain-containing protein [Pseudomonas syringae]TES69215.1 DUF1534 domain-containing protein [Pseudomonas syringae pv. tomato]